MRGIEKTTNRSVADHLRIKNITGYQDKIHLFLYGQLSDALNDGKAPFSERNGMTVLTTNLPVGSMKNSGHKPSQVISGRINAESG